MKIITLLLVVAIIPISMMGQLPLKLNGTITTEISDNLLKDSPVSLKSIEKDKHGTLKAVIIHQESEEVIEIEEEALDYIKYTKLIYSLYNKT